MGVGFHAFRIQGHASGAYGVNGGGADPDLCIFPKVDVSTSFGKTKPVECRILIMTGDHKIKLSQLSPTDLMAANCETADETGIPCVTDYQDDQAIEILKR